MTAPKVNDAMVIRIMASYLHQYENSSRIQRIADTLMLCANRVEQAAKDHIETRNEMDALIDLAGSKAGVTEIAEEASNRLPEWLTIKHGGPG